MTPDNKTVSGPEGCGMFIDFLMGYLLLTVVIAVGWNVGLYGAGLVDNKIDFWTALGMAFCVSIIRYGLSGLRANKTQVDQHFHNNSQENK